jgi:hypothetical protein
LPVARCPIADAVPVVCPKNEKTLSFVPLSSFIRNYCVTVSGFCQAESGQKMKKMMNFLGEICQNFTRRHGDE